MCAALKYQTICSTRTPAVKVPLQFKIEVTEVLQTLDQRRPSLLQQVM